MAALQNEGNDQEQRLIAILHLGDPYQDNHFKTLKIGMLRPLLVGRSCIFVFSRLECFATYWWVCLLGSEIVGNLCHQFL